MPVVITHLDTPRCQSCTPIPLRSNRRLQIVGTDTFSGLTRFRFRWSLSPLLWPQEAADQSGHCDQGAGLSTESLVSPKHAPDSELDTPKLGPFWCLGSLFGACFSAARVLCRWWDVQVVGRYCPPSISVFCGFGGVGV